MSRILICVSGSIAAYKIADVVSSLVKQGHEVQCILTGSAKEFVTPTVLETLSRKPVYSRLFGPEISGTEHIRLARWPDLIVFAPITAHSIAKVALGLADDLPSTVILASDKPLLLVPAMNAVMWNQSVVQSHLKTLQSRGAKILEPAEGILACGEEGQGKLATPDAICAKILELTETLTPHHSQPLSGQRLLMTAGPTTSAIDAVRYLTNPSTGKMGAALAEEAIRLGAEVDYVLGKDKGVVTPQIPAHAAERFHLTLVTTAEEMAEAALRALPLCHGVIATAAVMDYRVKTSVTGKLKRTSEPTTLELVPSIDVLAALREAAGPDQWFFGFAAETDALEENALKKIAQKKLSYLFANRVARTGETLETGFGTETNSGRFYIAGAESPRSEEIQIQSKSSLARELLLRVHEDQSSLK